VPIGPFADLLVFRCDLRDDPSFREAVRRVRDTALAAYTNQDLPYGAWAEQSTTASTRRSQVRAVLAVSDRHDLLDEPPFVSIPALEPDPDLVLHLAHADGDATVVLDARTDLFETAEMERVLRTFGTLIESMVSRPEQSMADAALMTDDDRTRLKVLRSPAGVPSVDCVHDLVATQVTANPDAVALISGSERLSYRELDERANRLAHHLRARGIGREDRVGVYCERTADAVVAMLGVLKAGGAYLPLDPSYPVSWIAFVLGGLTLPLLRLELWGRLFPTPRAQAE
jgi:non-ribosomal peptide synthetase component F